MMKIWRLTKLTELLTKWLTLMLKLTLRRMLKLMLTLTASKCFPVEDCVHARKSFVHEHYFGFDCAFFE